MTAPASIHPRSIEDLYPGALALTDQLGELPSRNRLMKEFKIGVPKATELRERLIAGTDRLTKVDTTAPPVDPMDYAEPIGPQPAITDEEMREAVAAAQVRVNGHPGQAEDNEPDRPRRRWFRRRPTAGQSPQVPVDGHPGPKIPPAPAPVDAAQLKSLKRIRWAVRLVLALGVAASIAGNVLHARDSLISQVISAWSPLALLLTIELISRVPVHSRRLAIGRWAATALIAGIAAWVSYWHMAAVAARYGETNGAQYLLPLSVDGLVVVASICLVELGGRIAANIRR
ncbi:DUF2637 domain-containing protein [Micromonospora tarensis]|uniref:DUF2637 domain-containing protein n=1 Tax=Micromonospora tarensis TaxID=2806100 RepID=A0ABS1YEG7_9ACTN|nr:DUF2637 domain-containing protein [Micromonospora tarensis]MBM0275810.1 DUF2637 domain-containing protein [Micromonospora tarensis]